MRSWVTAPRWVPRASPQHVCDVAMHRRMPWVFARRFVRSPSIALFELTTNCSADGRMWPVSLAARHHGPHDTGHLVGQRNGRHLRGRRVTRARNHALPLPCSGRTSRITASPQHQQLAHRSLPGARSRRGGFCRRWSSVSVSDRASGEMVPRSSNWLASTVSASVSAPTGPMPGTAASCWLTGLVLCSCFSRRSSSPMRSRTCSIAAPSSAPSSARRRRHCGSAPAVPAARRSGAVPPWRSRRTRRRGRAGR